MWEAKLKPQVDVRCFDGPRSVFQAIAAGDLDLNQLHTVITDHYFSPDDRMTGLELARDLRAQGFKGRILLASSGEFSQFELAGIVDKVVDKNPVSWDLLNDA